MTGRLPVLVLLSVLSWACLPVCLADSQPATSGPQILEEFQRQQRARTTSIAEHERQVIMFSIGAVLLLALVSTASVGIAVGVFGKPLFLLHMILAAVTVTLAVVHVIVGVVWFFPF
jgi:hypothetical protein